LGHGEVLAVLLSHGAQANSKDGEGTTPLMIAARRGPISMVHKLLQVVGNQGLADMDAYGRTALHHAASRGCTEVVTLLLSRGAEVQTYDSEGNTPLMLACKNNYLGTVRALLRHTHSQGLNKRDADGRTALHLACVNDLFWQVDKDIVKALLFAGADPTVVNKYGVTPRRAARLKGQTEAVSVFEVSQRVSIPHFTLSRGHQVWSRLGRAIGRRASPCAEVGSRQNTPNFNLSSVKNKATRFKYTEVFFIDRT
jgi:ankyrin repeat protein